MRRIGGGEKGLLVGSSSSTSCSTLFEHYVLFYVLFELSTQVELIRVLYILILNFHHGAMSSRCNLRPCSLLIDLSSMLDGYTILRA